MRLLLTIVKPCYSCISSKLKHLTKKIWELIRESPKFEKKRKKGKRLGQMISLSAIDDIDNRKKPKSSQDEDLFESYLTFLNYCLS